MRIGPYELVSKLGAGGMAEVWMARRAAVGGASKAVAVKRLARHLADKPDYRAMFLAEARLSMLLNNSNIVQVFDAGEDQGEVYLAMEWIDGIDLAQVCARLRETGERLSTTAVAHVIAELLGALAYAHDLRDETGAALTVVHRDVSPQNVMLSVSGEVKLMDFGIARLQSEETSGMHVKGKVRYMPPEQLRGDARAPTIDLFAVGAILQELLDGERFRSAAADEARLYGMVLDGEVPEPRYPDEIPPELEVLRQRLLADDPDDRIADAHEALELLYGWPGFRNAKLELAALVRRLRGVEAPSTGGTTVREQPTFTVVEAGTELLAPLSQDPAASRTRLLVGHGGDELTGDNPATERRAKADVDELEPTELVERGAKDATIRETRTEPPAAPPSRKPGRTLALGLAGALALAGIGYGLNAKFGWFGAREPDPPTTPDPSPSEPPVDAVRHARVLGDSFSGYVVFRSPILNELDQQGIRYGYADQPEQKARLAALAAGEAEFALTTLDRVLREQPAGKIVAIVDLSIGGDALVLDTAAHPQLRTLADLPALLAAGGRPELGYAGASPSEFLSLHLDELFAALDRDELGVNDRYADAAEVYAALVAPDGATALAILWEPWISKAVDAGMTVAVSTRDLPHAIIDVLVASDRVLAEDPELVDAVVLAYYRQAIAALRDPRPLREQLAAETGLGPDEVARISAGLCLLSPLGAEPWFNARPAPTDGEPRPAMLDLAIRQTWATLALHGRVWGKLGEPADYYDPRAINAAAADTRELLDAAGVAGLGMESACVEAQAKLTGAAELGPLELPRGPLREQPWFEPKSTKLAVDPGALLDAVAVGLRDFNPRTIAVRVVGFGDTPGYNGRKLGEKRAEPIARMLRERGVDLRIEVAGRDSADAPSRRVELELVRLGAGG